MIKLKGKGGYLLLGLVNNEELLTLVKEYDQSISKKMINTEVYRNNKIRT